LCILFVSFIFFCVEAEEPVFVLPFNRTLSVGDEGSDVLLLRMLVERCVLSHTPLDEPSFQTFDHDLESDLCSCQKKEGIVIEVECGVADAITTNYLLENFLDRDGYRDWTPSLVPQPFKYKVHIKVCENRSIETTACLFGNESTSPLHTFTVRTRGQEDHNQWGPSGNTPTGLSTFDLNSPEEDPKMFGPYPINRVIRGLAGNAQWVLPWLRDGILMHTGEWEHWDPSKPMPDSHGCIHAHPEDIKTVWQILVNELDVKVHKNTDGKLPYPYEPQGLLSIELATC
jgi:hypothetical protein